VLYPGKKGSPEQAQADISGKQKLRFGFGYPGMAFGG